MISISHADHEDEKKVESFWQTLEIALGEAINTCSKQKVWRLEWNHTAQTFHNRMKFLYEKKEIEDDPAAWGVLKTGSYLAGVVRTFGMYAGKAASLVLNFWWRASLPSLTSWIKADYKVEDHGRLAVKRILAAFGQPGGLLWINDDTKSLFFKSLRRAAKYVEALGRGDVESFYWEQMHLGGMALTCEAAKPAPMLQLAGIGNKKMEQSQLDFIPPNSIIPGSDVPAVLGEVIAKGLRTPFFEAVRSIVPKNLKVKAGPAKTTARIRVKAMEYKKEYELNPQDNKSRKYRESFMKAFNVQPKEPHDFAFQVVDLARVSVTFNQPLNLVGFVKQVETSSFFEILSIKNLFHENVMVKPSGYRDLKILVKFSCPTSQFRDFFKSNNIPETMSFVCELQCILEKWEENKIKTSLSYKLLRPDNINDCLIDFRKYAKNKENKASYFQDEKLQHEVQQGSFEAGLLLGSRATLSDTAHLPNLLYQHLNSMVNGEVGEELRIRKVNEEAKDGFLPLQKAIYFWSIECMQLLVRCKANVNATNKYGTNALLLAAELGNKSIVSFLLSKGATVNYCCIYAATHPNNHKVLEILLRHSGVSYLEQWQWEALLNCTIIRGWVTCLRLLLLYIKDENPALEVAFDLAKEKDRHACIQELDNFKRKLGMWANESLEIYNTSLGPQRKKLVFEFHSAAQHGDINKVIYFLERGIDVNIPNVTGTTAIWFSATHDHIDISKLLLQLDAHVNFSETPRDPVFIAIEEEYSTTLDLLLSAGANPNISEGGQTPLDLAYEKNQILSVKLLKKYSAKTYLEMRCIDK